MSGKTINFDDKKISKSNFYRNKELFNIDGIVNHIAKKVHLNFFIGYNDNDDIRPFCIRLPQMI